MTHSLFKKVGSSIMQPSMIAFGKVQGSAGYAECSVHNTLSYSILKMINKNHCLI